MTGRAVWTILLEHLSKVLFSISNIYTDKREEKNSKWQEKSTFVKYKLKCETCIQIFNEKEKLVAKIAYQRLKNMNYEFLNTFHIHITDHEIKSV